MKFLLIGGNRRHEDGPLLSFALKLIDWGFDVNIVTEDLHLNMPTSDGRIFADRLIEHNISPIVLDEISVDSIRHLVDEQTWGLSINAIWIISQEVIDLFGGRLFNYHNARLPQESGAACYTWKILRNHRKASLIIHDLTKEIDAGNIRMAFDFDIPLGTQAEIYEQMRPLEDYFLGKWARECEEGGNFPVIVQDQAERCYFPTLDTMANGWIDWSWTGEEIASFIMAFDSPHLGASTMLGEKRLHLINAQYSDEVDDFHPFHAGIIFRKTNGRIYIAARGSGGGGDYC